LLHPLLPDARGAEARLSHAETVAQRLADIR